MKEEEIREVKMHLEAIENIIHESRVGTSSVSHHTQRIMELMENQND